MLKTGTTLLAAAFLLACPVLPAQTPNPVQWSLTATPQVPARTGARLTLAVTAEVQEGWHVYAVTQAPGGPTPLHIALPDNGIVQAAGPVVASTPSTQHDASFNLETQTYSHAFTLHLPVQIKRTAPVGQQQVPVDVRYQSCSERTCLPPRTVHLLAPVEIAPR